jgi:hypothetical protein
MEIRAASRRELHFIKGSSVTLFCGTKFIARFQFHLIALNRLACIWELHHLWILVRQS